MIKLWKHCEKNILDFHFYFHFYFVNKNVLSNYSIPLSQKIRDSDTWGKNGLYFWSIAQLIALLDDRITAIEERWIIVLSLLSRSVLLIDRNYIGETLFSMHNAL